MEQEWDLTDISDGKLYDIDDLVKVGCRDCKGCSACCHNMGNSIVLDPYDIYQLATGLGQTVEELLATALELRIVDGIILPDLRMQGDSGSCHFLNTEGRCSIHKFRPGFCRMFPLGRLYENQKFRYFIQVKECKAGNRTKVKIRQWLDIPEYKQYEAFIADWHFWLKEYQDQIKQGVLKGEALKQFNLQLLTVFFLTPYNTQQDFYQQYAQRREAIKALTG